MIDFIEHESAGYTGRTLRNISNADMTLAFAADFSTAGEKLTRSLCDKLNKPYAAINITTGFETYDRLRPVLARMEMLQCKSLNIAGNGIYTLKTKYTQADLDSLIREWLGSLLASYKKPVDFHSGGQTGVDEAGLKFGDEFNLNTTCTFPKGWMFRGIRGNDICDKYKFLERFGPYAFLF